VTASVSPLLRLLQKSKLYNTNKINNTK